MNSPTLYSNLSPSSAVLLLTGLAFVFAGSAAGQSAQGPPAANATRPAVGSSATKGSSTGATPGTGVVRGDDERKVLVDAKALAKGNNLSAAEQKLTTMNVAKANTADWHMETNHRLMQLADSLTREGQRTTTKALVTQSLQHLDEAEKLAKTAKEVRGQAQAKAAAGRIHERYRGDPVTAIAAYQAALQLTPDDKPMQEALDRLQRSYANAQAKVKQPGKR